MSKGPWEHYAPHMLKGGYSPIPVLPTSKRPAIKRWPDLRDKPMSLGSMKRLAARQPDLGIAVAGGHQGLVPIDFDTEDEDILAAAFSVLPEATVRKKGKRGFVGFYRWDDKGPPPGTKFEAEARDGRPGGMLVEILGTGKTVIPPSVHPGTKAPYEWLTSATLYTRPVGNLVPITARHIKALDKALRPWLPPPRPVAMPKVRISTPGIVTPQQLRYAHKALREEAYLLAGMAPNSGRNRQLFKASCKIGKYVHAGWLHMAEVVADLVAACKANGLWREDGARSVQATIASGVRRAANDGLPALGRSDGR